MGDLVEEIMAFHQTSKNHELTKQPPQNQPACASNTEDKEEDRDEILEKYSLFKPFDTVGDYSDHHYAKQGSNEMKPQNNWSKVIQEEWKMLEMGLPETIFVRVYEERMDLLRAVIIGPAGTPYHDGLFFFDVFFPSTYPTEPPQVHYHAGGLRLNPNLYECGYVCLSLLNTWGGSQEERWNPGKSTMLQVLISIQALVLNAKPFFNEPGEEDTGEPEIEEMSCEYNEDAFILSCRTMLFSLRKPPRHFEEYVADHFRSRARDILVACKAYMEGAQVGCVVEGVRVVDEGNKSCSDKFKIEVGTMVKTLVEAFVKNGSELTTFLQEQNMVT